MDALFWSLEACHHPKENLVNCIMEYPTSNLWDLRFLRSINPAFQFMLSDLYFLAFLEGGGGNIFSFVTCTFPFPAPPFVMHTHILCPGKNSALELTCGSTLKIQNHSRLGIFDKNVKEFS